MSPSPGATVADKHRYHRAHFRVRDWLVAGLSLLLVACASFEPKPLQNWPDYSRIQAKTERGATVSAGILSDAEAEAVYGVDLSAVGLQAIWLRVDNRSEHSRWLMVSALDPNYFAPDEAAVLFYPILTGGDETRLTEHFRDLAIPLKTEAGEVTEGYVLAPRHEGGRYLTVSLIGRRHLLNFGFAITLTEGDFDFERLNPTAIYAGTEQPELNLEQLRQELRNLPCCVANADGEQAGDPMNLVLVGNASEVMASLSRAGWSFTNVINFDTIRRMVGAAISGASYPVAPVSPLYYLNRPQDIALQRARNTILQRNHLRLWLAPFRFQGRSVWVGQVSRDIDIKLTTSSSTLTTHVIDPNVDEAREHVLQSLLIAGAVARFGFVGGIEPATLENPHTNLSDDPYYTDGLRLVVLLSGNTTTSPEAVGFIEWQDSKDPLGREE
ncbi:LssY C-terminal domain-containing protein [Pseudomonadota bacterium]